jgi:lipid-A-disaccharide synthase
MISAGEVSGDMHASYLAQELRGFELFGMGGEKMREADVDVRIDITDRSSVGIIEALKDIPSQLSVFNRMKRLLRSERPAALILVDAQGFNMPLAKYAKKLGIRTIYYVAPQEWLWGSKKGVKVEAKTIDLIISIFKKEHEVNSAAGANSFYFGHPLLDIVKPKMTKEAFCKHVGLDPAKKIIALCPGSRKHEIRSLLPILIETAKKLGEDQYILPVSTSKFADHIERMVKGSGINIKVIEGFNYDVLAHADLAISKSGTIILESVILGTPVIMFYKLSRLTYYIGKLLMKINLPFYSMPNLLAGREVVPEFVMEKATAKNLSAEAFKILADPSKIKSGYQEVLRELGEPGAVKKSAEKIIEFVGLR